MGRKRLPPKPRVPVRFPPEIHERLWVESAERGVSINALVVDAVRKWIANQDSLRQGRTG